MRLERGKEKLNESWHCNKPPQSPGLTLTKLAALVGRENTIYGADLSTSMLELTRQRLLKNGFQNFILKEADSRSLPFKDSIFDVLYNAYMLDLIPERDMSPILKEFKRVLRPDGRLVLLNMSKTDEALTPRERMYQAMPSKIALYMMGACRPVLMENLIRATGFTQVSRIFLDGKAPSEIVLGVK